VDADVDNWYDEIDTEDLDSTGTIVGTVTNGPDSHKALLMGLTRKYNGATVALNVNEWELWGIIKFSADSSGGAWTWWGWSTNFDGLKTYATDKIALYRANVRLGGTGLVAAPVDGDFHLIRLKVDFTLGELTAWVDGVLIGTDTGIGTTKIQMSSHIGNSVADSDAWHTYGEWAIFDGHLDDVEAHGLNQYFRSQYSSLRIVAI
jgi:hypothetical protein